MPVKAEQRAGKWRVVNVDTGTIETNAAGTPVDGGGHETQTEAQDQARAINARKGVRAELINALSLGLPGFLTNEDPAVASGLAVTIKTGEAVGPFGSITEVPVGVLELMPASELARFKDARALFWVPLEAAENELADVREELTHNSKTADDEPQWGEVDKIALSNNAHADSDLRSFPHHFVRGGRKDPETGRFVDGDMFLHRGGLGAARAAAGGARSGEKASQKVIDHLAGHPSAEDLAKRT